MHMNKPIVFTIGHSTHSLDYFLDLLRTYSIDCVIDVRSIAASKFNPQYNQIPLSNFLRSNNIFYKHLSLEFGARQTSPDLLDDDGKVSFEKVQESWNFKKGVSIIKNETDLGSKVVLMCSESDPFDCHRFSMISIALSNFDFEVKHILKDKSLKTNEQLENQLLKKYSKKIPKPDIFNPNITIENQLKEAYKLLNKEIAYSPYLRNKFEENYD